MTQDIFHSQLEAISDRFHQNIDSINELMKFDETIQKLAITALEKAKKGLEKNNIQNYRFSVDKELQSLQAIRENASLQNYYEVMYNQCIVLLVSYFSSSIEDLFRALLIWRVTQNTTTPLPKEDIKLDISELIAISNNPEAIAQLVIDKKNISFQDTNSICRAFHGYSKITIEQDQTVNDIIFALSCRHAIVHNGAIANKKTIKQIQAAASRNIKLNLTAETIIQFSTAEIELVITAMITYVENLIDKLKAL